MQSANQGWQDAPLLERGGEPALVIGSCGAAPGAVPGGDQRRPTRSVAQDDRHMGRRSAAANGTVSGGFEAA